MNRSRLLSAVAARAGILDIAPVEQIVDATLLALVDHLDAPPATLVALLLDEPPEEPSPRHESFDALTSRIAESHEVRQGVAVEWVDSALTEIAAVLPPDARARVREQVPAAFGERLVDPDPRARPRPVGAVAHPGTLASGVTGASNSLADGAPSGAHRMSVAESDDPHGGRTLASAGRRRT